MTPDDLEREPAFALLAPGFFDDGRWRRFHVAAGGDAALWLAPYEGRPTRVSGRLEVIDMSFAGAPPPAAALDDARFEAGVGRIRERIAAGDVYQVNLTVRARLDGLSGAGLLSRLCARAAPRFAAWVRLPGLGELVSASPELLVETRARRVHAEPMKGTAPVGQRAALLASVKDEAELAMITDLTRNDLQQLCVRGTVRVTAPRRLVELPYVLQAVSDVEGELREGVTIDDVLRVMHPGGSVTGAPRPAAMALIAELEPTARRFYCGTLGVETTTGFRAALLIRTATHVDGGWEYGVGSGITWDSVPAAELAEVRLKLGALAQSG
ncbi:MAG: chorismate-binding protein [Myxococcaceae bacterium]|nr:chorismate-binding protein [Myxococcaceae bacterium]